MKFIRFQYQAKNYYGHIEADLIHFWSGAPWDKGVRLDEHVKLSEVKNLAPCIPGKVVALAINYPGVTGLSDANKEPLVLLKASTSVIGNNQIIRSPFPGLSVWGEPELAIVIGKKLTNASTEEANSAVFGYTIANDVTCENINDWDHHLARSKSPDTFCVLGPWIDSTFNPNGKTIRGIQNGKLIREGVLDQRLWKEPELLVWLSSWMTLEPGDVVLTGTPSRVGQRVFMKTGDEYICSIEGLGDLTNSFEEILSD